MNTITIDIKCPKCSNKATFHSKLVGTYKLYPEKKGKITCLFCGKNGEFNFSNKDYYYQIHIGDRKLYAKSLDDLIIIKNYFEKGLSIGDPNLDFPKEFYFRKEEIIKKINVIIEKEKGNQ